MQNSSEKMPQNFNVDPDLNMQEYMSFQRAIMKHDFHDQSFIEETKKDLRIAHLPDENQLAIHWVKKNSARFRDDPNFRSQKIAELSQEDIDRLRRPN